MTLHYLLKCEDVRINVLARDILRLQEECDHEYGPEHQNYNVYSKRCKKCAYLHSKEY